MLKHVKEVRKVNSAPLDQHWTTQLNCPAWRGREERIKNMIDYACSLSGNYLLEVKRNPKVFSYEHLANNFLEVSSEKFPISFNTVMIGTFSLSAIYAAYEIYAALSNTEIKWENAKVLLHNLVGTNYSAGLTPYSNWVYPTIVDIAGPQLDKGRIMIVPYAFLPETVGREFLPDKDFENLTQRVWGALYARSQITSLAFSNIKDIQQSPPAPIPGDYGYTKAENIDDFIMRLKYFMRDLTQMLSNTVGFWIAGEAAAKNWNVSKMDIPGLTHGFPGGLKAYPTTSPEIE